MACWGYLALAGGLWLAMRELGDQSWAGALLLFAPRWPYAVPLVLLWPWALVMRRWWSVAATAMASMVMIGPVLGFRVAMPRATAERGELRLLSCNIHRQNLDAAKLASYIESVKPEVVALQGWSDMHQEALFPEGQWEVHRQGELLLASRFPVGRIETLKLADDPDVAVGEQGSAALYEIRMPRGTVSLISLHLASPHAGLNSMWSDKGERLADNVARREREAAKVRELAGRTQGTLVFAGDFNTTSESPIFRQFWGDFTDAFLERGFGLGFTYWNNHTQIRIDHVVVDASCDVLNCWVGPDVNAAHRPLVADIDFR